MPGRDFHVTNRRKLLETLPDRSVAVFFAGEKKYVSEDWLYPFSPNRNYFYLTGLRNHGGIMMLVKYDDLETDHLFVRRPEPRLELYKGKMNTPDEYAECTGFTNVKYLDEFPGELGGLLIHNSFQALYVDHKKRSLDDTMCQVACFINTTRNSFPAIEIRDVRPLVSKMRQIKTPEEQALMRMAAGHTAEGVRRTVRKIAPGVYTYELYAEFEYYLRQNGLSTCAFESVITAGKECLIIHSENYSQIKDGETVLIDVGAEYEHYASDICRVYPASGKFTPEQRFYYNAVIEAEETIIKALKPGFDITDIGPMGDDILIKRCRDGGILKKDEEIRKYLNHGIYHFLGLDSHDVGETDTLEPGMVISIEPGLYIEQLGLAVRVEDNILITEDGNENLTAKIPKTPDEIESEMEKSPYQSSAKT